MKVVLKKLHEEYGCISPFFPKDLRNKFTVCKKSGSSEKVDLYEKYVYNVKFGKNSDVSNKGRGQIEKKK